MCQIVLLLVNPHTQHVQMLELECRSILKSQRKHEITFDEIELDDQRGLKADYRPQDKKFPRKETGNRKDPTNQCRLQDEGGAGGGLQLGFVAGVILRERLPAFEKMLWRACRGNVFLRQAEIEDPLEDPQAGDQVFKSVFVIFFQGKLKPPYHLLQSYLSSSYHDPFPAKTLFIYRRTAEVPSEEDLRRIPGDALSLPGPGGGQAGDGGRGDAAAGGPQHRPRPNQRPQAQGPRCCCQEHQDLVCQGPEDQGNLPHVERIQLGHVPEVFDSGVLDPTPRHGGHSAGTKTRNREIR